MTHVLEINGQLTPDELKQVKAFAEFLISRRRPDLPTATESRPKYINVDALMGMCRGMGGDRTDDELIREAWDHVIDKLDD